MKYIITILFFLNSCIVVSQNSKESSFWDNVSFGGGFGLGFGNNTTNIAISPTAIYNFNEKTALGVSLGYQYAKRNNIKSNVFNTGILSLFNPIKTIQLSAEFEQLFINQSFGSESFSDSYPALYFGIAYRVSKNVSMGIRYDVLYDTNKSIYASAISPVFRVFF